MNPEDLNYGKLTDEQVKQLLDAFKDPSLRERIIEAGKKQAEKFSWDLSAQKHYESYKKALEGNS